MSLSVWKYEININRFDLNGEIAISMPLGAEILTAREQHNKVCVWARVDPNQKSVGKRMFAICNTGGEAPHLDYVGTAMLHGGEFVVHVFVRPMGQRTVPR